MWRGAPVVSTVVDPDGMLGRSGAGRRVDDDLAALRSAVEALLSDERGVWRAASRSGWAYVREHHASEQIAARFLEIARAAAERPRN